MNDWCKKALTKEKWSGIVAKLSARAAETGRISEESPEKDLGKSKKGLDKEGKVW